MMADLKALAELGLAKASQELTRTGEVTPMFVVREEDGTIKVIAVDGRLMNSGSAKDRLFDGMRMMVAGRRLSAVVFISEGWVGKQTAKGAALPEKVFLERARERGFETAVKDGLVVRGEAILVTAQTADGTFHVQQEFIADRKRRTVVFGDRRDVELKPDEFRGRMKMYGDLSPENLG
jgi:hypothetical protein